MPSASTASGDGVQLSLRSLTSTADTSETGIRSRTVTTRVSCSCGPENRETYSRTVRVDVWRWVIPAVEPCSSLSRTTR